MEETSAKHPLCHQPSLALHFFLSFLLSNVSPPEQTNSCATNSLFLSFTSFQVSQFWSHRVDTLLDETCAGSPAPTSNPYLSSCFPVEHFILASFFSPSIQPASLLSPFSCLSTQCLHLPTVHLFIPVLQTFFCTSQHSPVHFFPCISSICSLLAFLSPSHHSTHAVSPPLRRYKGRGGQMSCPTSCRKSGGVVVASACAQCWRLSWLAEGSTAVRCAPPQPNTPVSPQNSCQ